MYRITQACILTHESKKALIPVNCDVKKCTSVAYVLGSTMYLTNVYNISKKICDAAIAYTALASLEFSSTIVKGDSLVLKTFSRRYSSPLQGDPDGVDDDDDVNDDDDDDGESERTNSFLLFILFTFKVSCCSFKYLLVSI